MFRYSFYSFSFACVVTFALSGCDLLSGAPIKEKSIKLKPGISSRPFNASTANVGRFIGEDIKQLANHISINYPQSAPINLEVEVNNQSADTNEQADSAFGLFGFASPDEYLIAFTPSSGYELNHIEGVGLQLTLNDGLFNYLTETTEENIVERTTNNVFFDEYVVRESDVTKYQILPISYELEQEFPKIIPMSDKQALKLKEAGMLIMVRNLKEPWMQSLLSKEVSTIEQPAAGNRLELLIYMDLVQIWLADKSDGSVVQKWRKN